MANQYLNSLSYLDISSVTNINSLFMYCGYGGTSYAVSGGTLSKYVLGLPRHFVTLYRADSYDLTPNTWTTVDWTNVLSDTYGFRDVNSDALIRVPDDKITALQFNCMMGVEESTFGARIMRLVCGGLPSGMSLVTNETFQSEEDWESSDNVYCIWGLNTPLIKVQSGSYFSLQIWQGHSVNRMMVDNTGHSGDRQNYFNAVAWSVGG